MSTAKISEPISGDKKYQLRARAALPLLVRQAQAGVPIFYSDLAKELEMPNPRNLNFVLGSIGQSLERLSKEWSEDIPPIQCLVINKNTGLPGEGIGWFLDKKVDFSTYPLRRKRAVVESALADIFSYSHWDDVLKALELKPVASDFSTLVRAAAMVHGGGESQHHKALKEYVALNPRTIGTGAGVSTGKTEYRLPSGDSLDVSFMTKTVWIGVEVKSAISSKSDILRGLFQCVKYRAVMEAVLITQASRQSVRTILVLESFFPRSLLPLKHLLGIEVIDKISPPSTSCKSTCELDTHGAPEHA